MYKIVFFILTPFFQQAFSACPTLYRDYDGLCYRLIADAQTLEKATETCKGDGGWLPSTIPAAPGKKITKQILDKANTYVYIGANYDDNQECFNFGGTHCLKSSEIEFWREQPNETIPESTPCVMLMRDANFKAEPYSCGANFFAVCTGNRDQSCTRAGYLKIMHLCLLFVEQEDTFDNQKATCEKSQGELAFVYSKSDWQVLGQTLILMNGPGPFGFFANVKKETTGWVDGDGNAISDDAWLPGHPDISIGKCALMVPEMESLELKLQTSPCVTQTGFICQQDGETKGAGHLLCCDI